MSEVQARFSRNRIIQGRYVVEELLGRGGFGAVYRVRDRRVKGNVFALKELVDPTKYQRENFAFECEVLRRLDHYALPRVYQMFEDKRSSRSYMLMDYIEGPNLEKLRLRQPEQRFSLSQVMALMAPIIDAVRYLHAQQPQIIHRDIKPSNIIVPSSGEGAVLVDFGIAKEYDQDATTTAVRHCSPGYGAPEQYVRGTNTRTDIYGLAATFYTLLTGEVPIDALFRITRLSSKGTDPLELANVLVPGIPAPIAEALQRAMAVNSNDRFATVEEFWETLKAHTVEQLSSTITVEAGSLTDQSAVTAFSLAPIAPETPLVPNLPETSTSAEASPVTTAGNVLHGGSNIGLPRWGRLLLFSIVAFVIIAVVVSVIINGNVGNVYQSQVLTHPIVPVTRTSVSRSTSGPTPIASVLPTPKASVASSPTPPSSSYPQLATNYSGNIHNTPADVGSTMSLAQVKQDGASIKGGLQLGPGLLGGGNFSGTVTADNKMQFLVPSNGSILPLFFQGQIQADGKISGTYCSYQNGQCNQSGGGYGSWNVSPSSVATKVLPSRLLLGPTIFVLVKRLPRSLLVAETTLSFHARRSRRQYAQS